MGILLVIKNEYKKSLRNKKKLFISLIISIIAVVVSIEINSFMKPSVNIGIISEGDSRLEENFKEKLSFIDGVKIGEGKKESINTDMIMGKYMAIIEFGNDNDHRVYALDDATKELVNNLVDNFIGTGEVSGFNKVLEVMKDESLNVSERSVGFILLALLINSTIMACSIIKDKEEGVLRRLVVGPNNILSYLLGYFFYNLAFTLLEIVIASIALTMLGVSLEIGMLGFLLLGGVVALISTCISTFICSICNSELQASIIASSFGLISSLLGGTFLAIEKMPDGIKFISNFTFTKWLIDAANLYGRSEYLKVAILLLSLGGICLITVLLSIKLGKRKFI